jgi:nucleoside-diphosphate-sugar epimerase
MGNSGSGEGRRKITVAVAGASGALGRRICRALANKPNVVVRGIVRQGSPVRPEVLQEFLEMERVHGVCIVQANLENQEQLRIALQDVDVVISALAGDVSVILDGQKRLINAAVEAGVRKFIPSDFCPKLDSLQSGDNPWLDFRRDFAAYARTLKNIHVVHVYTGCFSEVFWSCFGIYDKEARAIRYYGSAEQRMDITSMQDVAEFTAEIALDESAPESVNIVGDTLTLIQLQGIYKEVTGLQLNLTKLGEISDLRKEIQELRQQNEKDAHAYAHLMFQLPVFDGNGLLDKHMNSCYPQLCAKTMKEFLQEYQNSL